MSRLVHPRWYPHRLGKAYTLSGFRQRVVPHLRARGFTLREAEKLEELYFAHSDTVRAHLDECGIYRNVRRCRLYALTRSRMKYDRKNRLFDLIVRSGMFYVYLDDNDAIRGFVSPHVMRTEGFLVM